MSKRLIQLSQWGRALYPQYAQWFSISVTGCRNNHKTWRRAAACRYQALGGAGRQVRIAAAMLRDACV